MYVGRNGWSTRRNGGDWLKRNITPEKKREEERHELEQRQRERREAAITRLASHGLSILNIARHCLKEQEHEEKVALRDRQAQLEQRQRLPRFKHWLGKRSPRLGTLWRFKRRITPHMRVRPFEFPRTGALFAPFPAYREMVKRRFADVKLARSPLDYMTALYLRCAGYTKAEVSEELARHAPAPSSQREKNIRVFYEHRIVGQAFGVAGDIDIASFQPTPERIQNFNHEAEEMERERITHKTRERQTSTFRLR